MYPEKGEARRAPARSSTPSLLNTGGFDEKDQGPFSDQIKQQVINAVEEADQIIFMMDGP